MDDEEVTIQQVYKVISDVITKNSTLTDAFLLRGFVGKIEINVAPDHKIKNINYTYNDKHNRNFKT